MGFRWTKRPPAAQRNVPSWFLADIDAAVRIEQLIDPALSEGYTLLAAHAAGVEPSLTTATYARHIARNQQPDGYWSTFDGRPPHSAGLFVATAVALRAVSLYLPAASHSGPDAYLNRARVWLANATPESTEDLTYRLLGLVWSAAAPEQVKAAGAALAAVQRTDGGWGQLPAMPASDAYSTAQALYALRRAGFFAAASPAFQRGIEWLLKNQAPDGSWLVRSRIKTPAAVSPPYFESGFPYGHDQYLSCAATAWAVMALTEALPPVAAPARPLPLRTVTPKAEPWMETALFGTPAQVAQLNPRLATPAGTTVLLMAADSPAKVRELLARGAKVNAAAQSGHDALMVAALFRDNRETLATLLKAGATAKARAKVRYGANPLSIATITGDVEMVRLLLDAGSDPNHVFRLLGQTPVTPLALAAQFDSAGLIYALVKGGARMDLTDPDGMTELAWAALVHKDASVRALLELGADPKVKDRFGLTPLEHAKGIEFSSDETEKLIRARIAR